MRAFRIGMSRRMETLEAAEKDSLQKLRQLPEGRLRIDPVACDKTQAFL